MSSVEESIAFVLDGSRTRPVGLAFLVTDRLLLTCAQVVNASLGRSRPETAPVPENVRIPLDFALLGSPDDWFELSARVVAWLPRSRPLELDEDIAVLRLGQDLSQVGAVPLKIRTEPGGLRMVDVQMWGVRAGERGGRHVVGRLMGPVGKHRLQVDEYVQGTPRVRRGFSGGPAWFPSSGEVVGMLQAINTDGGSAEVFVLAGAVLEQAVTSALPRRAGVVIAHDHGEVHYDGTRYSLRHSRLIGNHSPGQSTTVEYSYAVSDRQWGQWYQRHVREGTDRLSVAAHLPTELEPERWGMTWLPSRTGLEPLPHVTSRMARDVTMYTWDHSAAEDLQQGRRIRLDWFFWRRILDSNGSAAASDAMAQFGILQVRHPMRGRRLPSHVPAGVRVRSINLESDHERDMANRIVAHLRRVAGWVSRYHTFKPEVGMGIAAPQLGIAYRIAIVRKPHSPRFVELVNPRIVSASPELADEYEGCLSFFDVRGIVRRPVSVTVAHDRLDGEPVTTVFDGALARNVQHEIDHLNGKLYTDEDRMPPGMNPIPVDEYRANR